jgi:hypothetical protein
MLRLLLIPAVLALGAASLLLAAVASGSAVEATLVRLQPIYAAHQSPAGPVQFAP